MLVVSFGVLQSLLPSSSWCVRACAGCLSTVVRQTQLLQRLDIRGAALPGGGPGARAMAGLGAALRANESLTALSLAYCGLSKQGIQVRILLPF
jgi:hypothetical protein